MIRIAHLITGLETGGAQASLFNLLKGMDRNKFHSVVISLKPQNSMSQIFAQSSIQVYHLVMRREPFSVGLGMVRLVKILKAYRPHILQGWMYHANLVCTIAKHFLTHKPKVMWGIRHSLHELGREKRTTRWVIRAGAVLSKKADRIVYNAHSSAIHHRALGYDPAREVVIPNGVDLERFKPSPEARKWLRGEVLGIEHNIFLVGMVGRFHPIKGHDLFLEAAGMVAKEEEEVSFLMVGRGMEQSNYALRSLINANGLASKIFLLGERRDVERILPGLDLLCSPSRGESFPNAVVEAMACGVPCVVTDVGDCANIVGDCGFVVSPGDSGGIARALKAAIEMPPKHRAELSFRVRKHAEGFDRRSTVQRYSSLYEELVGQGLTLVKNRIPL